MERDYKKVEREKIRRRTSEARSLFKKCFNNNFFSLVPFEIWRDMIVSNADLKAIIILSQTCNAFKDIIDNIGEKNFNLALMLRREGQIVLARKYLLKCAENNNSEAIFHMGFSYENYCGWGLEGKEEEALKCYKRSSELGNAAAMAFYAKSLLNEELRNFFAQKALSSNNAFAVGTCHYYGLGDNI